MQFRVYNIHKSNPAELLTPSLAGFASYKNIMTLVLTRASQSYVIQVTDRLVTKGRKKFDELANKNIILHSRNAIVTIGYSGHAYIGNLPTDQWIAECLIGKTTIQGGKTPAISLGKQADGWLDIGYSLILLKASLDDAAKMNVRRDWRKDWKSKPFEVTIAGWQWGKKGRERPIIAWLSKEPGSNTFELGYQKRDWYFGRRMHLNAIPGENISRNHLESLTALLSNKSISETEALLVDAIRQRAKTLPEVGSECMSILLLPTKYQQVHVQYLPTKPAKAILAQSKSESIIKVAFSPWIIGPGSVYAPSAMSGEATISTGYYQVVLHAPKNPGIIGTMFGQNRPKLL